MSKVRNGKNMEQSLDYAAAHGWTVSRTGGGHLRFDKPGCQPVFSSSTPSCPYADKKTLIRMKQHERTTT